MINRIAITRIPSVRGQKCQYQIVWDYTRNNHIYGCQKFCDSKQEAILFSKNEKAMIEVSEDTANHWDEQEQERIKKYSKI